MSGDFSRQIKDLTGKYKKRMTATMRDAVQETAAIAQKPRGDGGNMPVVTNFLRASMLGAVGTMPSGETKAAKGKDYKSESDTAGDTLGVALLHWEPSKGEVFYVGWSAAYARRIEYGFYGADSLGRVYEMDDVGVLGAGYLRSATQKWSETVDSSAKKIKKRIP